jgi:hypothetical protein
MAAAIAVGGHFLRTSQRAAPKPAAAPLAATPTVQPIVANATKEVGAQWAILRVNGGSSPKRAELLERAVWGDPRVRAWLNVHATLIPLDPKRDSETARSLSIDGQCELVVAFKDYKEFDRIVGCPPPAELLEWLEGLERGERSVSLAPKIPPHIEDEAAKAAFDARWVHAMDLDAAGKAGEAADEYLWVWQNIEPFYYCKPMKLRDGVRSLTAKSKTARAKFAALRDQTALGLNAERVSPNDVWEWTDLNDLLGDTTATLQWFDSVRNHPRRSPLIRFAQSRICELLVAERRWSDLGVLFSEPMFSLDELLAEKQDIEAVPDPDNKYELANGVIAKHRSSEIGMIYAGLLASGKDAAAKDFAAKARTYFGAAPTAVVLAQWALRAGQPRTFHLDWLAEDPTDKDAKALREIIEQALKVKLRPQSVC